MTGTPNPNRARYAEAGVDLEERGRFAKGLPGILAQAGRPEVLGSAGAFSGLFQLGEGYANPVLASSADGIGTKVKVQMAAGRLDLCGPDILGHSVNDVMACGAEPLFFLDYIAGNGLTNEQKTALVQGVAQACADANVALLGGETADMPDVYAPGDFDLAGFIVGVAERDRLIDGSRIRPGHRLLGLPSTGLHTNGFSLARRALGICAGEAPEETQARLEERPPELGGQTVGEALLATHRAYYRDIAPVLNRIDGMAHITGGGFRENLPRALPPGLGAVVDTARWDPLPIFGLIAGRGGIEAAEMYDVFNMGIGLVLYVGPENEDAVLAALPEAVMIGQVVEAEDGSIQVLGT
ncbi:MAG: phosphoribosylformylglycinamidine cyclo-ligase [Dehalococcoidia bacterium]|nr:phosphoribosylformylglycinamidine cyclo-ligase [Dehalococcoidia bacterium]